MYITLAKYIYYRSFLNVVPLLLLALLLLFTLGLPIIPRAIVIVLLASLAIASIMLAYASWKSTSRHLRFLIDKQVQVAIQRERLCTAMTLHDTVAQMIFSISLITDAILAKDADPHDKASQLQQLRRLTLTTHKAMRHFLLDLQPTHIEEIPLNHLMSELVEVKQVSSDVDIQCTCAGTACYPAEIQLALYRIAGLALSNAIFHAQASRILIHLLLNPSEAILSIEDDGIGFDPDAHVPGHFGLENMRQHARNVGATLIFDTLPSRSIKKVTCIWRSEPCQ